MPLDRYDVRILELLQRNGRMRISDLAEQIGLSSTPCARRVARLESEGVIEGYSALISQKAIGLPLTAFVSIELEKHSAENLNDFEKRVSEWPEVVDCYLMTGSQDYLLRVAAATLERYELFLQNNLAKVSGIRSIRARFALRRIAGQGLASALENQ